jgi:hypothetical protein
VNPFQIAMAITITIEEASLKNVIEYFVLRMKYGTGKDEDENK